MLHRLVILACSFVVVMAGAPPAFPEPARTSNGTLIVLNKAEATASLIDVGSGGVVATVPTGEGPHEVDVSPGGRLAVVTNYGTRAAAGSTLTVIDVPQARVIRTIDLGEHRRPHGVVWSGDGRHVIVTVEGSEAIVKVDVEAAAVVETIETDQAASHMVAVTPDGKRAFVANIGSGSVSVLDLEKGQRIRNIRTGQGAEGITITPDGKEVWITNRADDTVTVIDTASLDILSEIESKSFPIRAKATPDGKYVLVSNARSGDVAVFDARTKKEIRRIPMNVEATDTDGRLFGGRFGKSSTPIGILIRPDGRAAYVANANADVIAVVDLETWKTTGNLKAGREPDGLGYSPHKVEAGVVAGEER